MGSIFPNSDSYGRGNTNELGDVGHRPGQKYLFYLTGVRTLERSCIEIGCEARQSAPIFWGVQVWAKREVLNLNLDGLAVQSCGVAPVGISVRIVQ
jgi:hypothetical protein